MVRDLIFTRTVIDSRNIMQCKSCHVLLTNFPGLFLVRSSPECSRWCESYQFRWPLLNSRMELLGCYGKLHTCARQLSLRCGIWAKSCSRYVSLWPFLQLKLLQESLPFPFSNFRCMTKFQQPAPSTDPGSKVQLVVLETVVPGSMEWMDPESNWLRAIWQTWLRFCWVDGRFCRQKVMASP